MLELLLIAQLGIASSTTNTETNLAWKNTKAAEIASDITLGMSLAVDTWDSFHCVDKKHCFIAQAERTGINLVAVEIVKRITHEERPDGSDFMSFYSGHTALTAMGPRLAFTLPLTGATGYFRMAAKKHYFRDVIFGAGVGLLTGTLIK